MAEPEPREPAQRLHELRGWWITLPTEQFRWNFKNTAGAPSSFLFLVVRPGAPSRVLAPSWKDLGPTGFIESGRLGVNPVPACTIARLQVDGVEQVTSEVLVPPTPWLCWGLGTSA